MHARIAKRLSTVGVVATALVGGACHRSAEEQRREAAQATREAERQASQTTITSADLGSEAGANGDPRANDAREAQDRAMREQAEAITAARNEQLAYREKLQRALDELDERRRDAKRRGPSHVKAIDARREVLKHHLEALDRTTDAEWAARKAKIDRDLKADRELEGK